MDAIYYDGQVARSRRVSLTIEDDAFVVTGDGVERRDPAGAVQIMEAIGRTPRVVRFVGGASCEIHDRDGFDALLRAHDIDQDKVSVLDRSWAIVGAAILFVVLVAAGGYRYGLPALARSMADRLPRSTLNTFSEHIQSVLDSTVFRPSELPAERQQTIRAEFDALRVPAGAAPSLQVSFRRADGVGVALDGVARCRTGAGRRLHLELRAGPADVVVGRGGAAAGTGAQGLPPVIDQ